MVFCQSCKTVSVFILIMHILLQKSEKHVTEKDKDWTFEVSLLIGEPISWFRLFESLKMTCARSYAWFLNFLPDGEGFDCFLWPNVMSKPSKMTETCPKSAKWLSILSSSKVAKWPVLKFMLSPIMRKLAGKPHSEGSTGYSASGGGDVTTS